MQFSPSRIEEIKNKAGQGLPLTKKERRILRRHEKQTQTEKTATTNKTKKAAIVLTILIIAGGIIYVGVQYIFQKEKAKPGEFFADLGQTHIAQGDTNHPTYNSNPPSSGHHWPEWIKDWRFYDEELPDEQLIHNLEHGGIWIAYKPDVSQETKDKIKIFVKKAGKKVIATQRSKNDSPIAVVAWTRVLKLQDFDERKIKAFLKAYRNKGPEQTVE